MISLGHYAGPWSQSPDWTSERRMNAVALLNACHHLESLMRNEGVVFQTNHKTNSQVSGTNYGGFRPQDCPIGAPNSAHKEGMAVDIYDPNEDIDRWILANEWVLDRTNLYLEDPDKTVGWSHWQIRPTKSGKRIFLP